MKPGEHAPLPPGAVIGIAGGGQLGRMLAMAAARLGYRTIVLDPDTNCPAAQVANDHVASDYSDARAIAEFAARCDVVTYEFENVPVDAMRLANDAAPVFPPPSALQIAQDRLVEKRFLQAQGIATAPFAEVESAAALEKSLAAMPKGGILKTRRFGYDGKGQVRMKPGDDAAAAFAELGRQPCIVEGLVDFTHEVSVVAARGRSGALSVFDPAWNRHEGGILRESVVPAPVSEALLDEARSAARRMLEALDYVGVIGVEFFVTRDGALLANEFAPRVHNSGHWTEAACAVSQFEQHIRAICGLPLGDPARHSDCRMENLIGDEIERLPALLAQPGCVVHHYGKAQARPGRKMGHFTRIFPRSG
jgi:5-(carboxyamino)imidazole ribonucleotide synthase